MLPDTSKPCVLIQVSPHPGFERKLREVQAGMEEEGIPWLEGQSIEPDAVVLAYQGACASKLGVGIGIGAEGLCIHHNKLPAGQPLFVLKVAGTPLEWRRFGYNAARLVKGIPFKIQAAETEIPQVMDYNTLYSLVFAIVIKVLQETVQGHGEVKAWSKTL